MAIIKKTEPRLSSLDGRKAEIKRAIYAWFDEAIATSKIMPGGGYSAEMVSDIALILLEVKEVGGNLSKLNPVTLSRIETEAAAFQPQPLKPEQLVYIWGQKHLEMRATTAPLIVKRRDLLDRLKLAETLEELEAIMKSLSGSFETDAFGQGNVDKLI